MTHQEIIDRMEALGVEHSKAYQAERARIAKETESLQELCGGLGHLFASDRSLLGGLTLTRVCLYCRAPEPQKAA